MIVVVLGFFFLGVVLRFLDWERVWNVLGGFFLFLGV